MFDNRPALKFCLPFIAGIVVGWYWSIPVLYVEGSVIVLFLLFVVYNVLHKSRLSPVGMSLLFCLMFLFGIFKIVLDAKVTADDNVAHFISSNETVDLHGRISDDPKINEKSIQFIIDVDEILSKGKQQKSSGGTSISIRKQDIDSTLLDSLVYGREIILTGKLTVVGGARNPGEFDLKEYYRINNIHARFILDHSSQIRFGPIQQNILSRIVYPIRRSIAHHLEEFIGGKEAAFLKGLMIGDRSEISPEIKDAFINAGVIHILAVSGLHVGMITLILFSVLTALRIPKIVRTVSLCLFLIVYIFLTGSSPSVVRAVIMANVLLLGTLWERRTDIYNSIAIAAIILLLVDAKNLFQAGFQLSFAAVTSIVYLYPKISALFNVVPEKAREFGVIKSTIALVSVSFSAAIGTLPFTSQYFGKISVIGLLANLIIVPMSGVVLALGITTTFVSYLSVWIASMFAETTKMLTYILLQCVTYFGNLSFSYIDSHFPFWTSIAFYAGVGLIANIQNRIIVRRLVIVSLFVANIIIYRGLFTVQHDNNLRITFLDVGQGDAAFPEFPGGKNMLIDAGPWTYNSDAGKRFVVPFLKYKGIDHINILVISHPHSDHLGGVPYVLRHVPVEELIDAGSYTSSAITKEITRLTDSFHIKHKILNAGTTIEGFENTRLFVLHPSGSFISHDSSSRINFNNQSLVLKLSYGQTSLLFSGDAEEPAEYQMGSAYGNFLSVNVVKTGHHGSITSSSSEFLQFVKPSVAVISVGQYNKFGHPSVVVLDRLKRMGCLYVRTDEHGAVVMESDGKKWSVVDWR